MRTLGVIALLLLCGTAPAYAGPIGDFGRREPSLFHDDALPLLGKGRAMLSGEPVSRFNLTDHETEMHNRIWRFLIAPHAHDWFYDVVTELQRTRLSATTVHRFKPDRYYDHLRRERFQSSRIRFRAVADAALSDVDTAPSTFRAICVVLEVDRQRATASRELGGMSHDDVVARRAENEMWIDWFANSLRYRYVSYSYALDHLLVETPHEEALETDRRLSELAIWVDRADRGDFCTGSALSFGDRREEAIPSRMMMPAPGEGDYRK